MTPIDKNRLVEQIAATLESELALLADSVAAASEAATHEQSKPENKYDTRALEASYLAGAQKERVAELQASLGRLRSLGLRDFPPGTPIGVTAVVELNTDGVTTWCFLVPVGGGRTLRWQDQNVMAITPQSPLGAALLGKVEGDQGATETSRGPREFEVVSVR